MYKRLTLAYHENVVFQTTGLYICKDRPFLAATPDMIVECSCCGRRVVEVKCPFSVACDKLEQLPQKQNAYVSFQDGELKLHRAHAYFYQVQCQMLVCEVDHADFVLWTREEVNVERIERDAEFLERAISKAESMFIHAILPEMIACWFTRRTENMQLCKQ